jgi:actin-like ATPase involved in cell morphogenesis
LSHSGIRLEFIAVSNTGEFYYGLDLGGTCSGIAYVDDAGRPAVTGADKTPSVVFFDRAGNVIVGSAAEGVPEQYSDRVFRQVKRHIGTETAWDIDGTTQTPESISSLIIRQLAQDAVDVTGCAVTQVVMTVPAYFGMRERDATSRAARLAGLTVIDIVPEPCAVALGYQIDGSSGDRTVVVFDLGGSSFDVTVLRTSSSGYEVLCTDGCTDIDWNERLADHLADRFVDQASPAQDPRDDESFRLDMAGLAEQTKVALSDVEVCSVPIRFDGYATVVEVSRVTFEALTEDLLDYVIAPTKRVLGKLREKYPAAVIDDVLLAGGSSRMPMIARRLTAEFGWMPQLREPDLVIAKGAALVAQIRSKDKQRIQSAAGVVAASAITAALLPFIQALASKTGEDVQQKLKKLMLRSRASSHESSAGESPTEFADPSTRLVLAMPQVLSQDEQATLHDLLMALTATTATERPWLRVTASESGWVVDTMTSLPPDIAIVQRATGGTFDIEPSDKGRPGDHDARVRELEAEVDLLRSLVKHYMTGDDKGPSRPS